MVTVVTTITAFEKALAKVHLQKRSTVQRPLPRAVCSCREALLRKDPPSTVPCKKNIQARRKHARTLQKKRHQKVRYHNSSWRKMGVRNLLTTERTTTWAYLIPSRQRKASMTVNQSTAAAQKQVASRNRERETRSTTATHKRERTKM